MVRTVVSKKTRVYNNKIFPDIIVLVLDLEDIGPSQTWAKNYDMRNEALWSVRAGVSITVPWSVLEGGQPSLYTVNIEPPTLQLFS